MRACAMFCGGWPRAAMETADQRQAELTERRIARLTLAVGGAAAAGAWWWFSPRDGAGVLIGALLAWLNFRWLAGALDALVRVTTERGAGAKARVPLWSAARLLGRYALIALCVYAIFSFFRI